MRLTAARVIREARSHGCEHYRTVVGEDGERSYWFRCFCGGRVEVDVHPRRLVIMHEDGQVDLEPHVADWAPTRNGLRKALGWMLS